MSVAKELARILERDFSKSANSKALFSACATAMTTRSDTVPLQYVKYRDVLNQYAGLLEDYRVGSSGDSMDRIKKTAAMCGLEVTRNKPLGQ